MSRKGENIYKRKDGRWEGRYIKSRNKNGKIKYGYVYARTYRDVKIKLKDAAISSKDYTQIPEISSDSFYCIAEEWIRKLKPQVKESTINKYENLLESYIYPDFKDKPLKNITHEFIESHCSRLLLTGGTKGTGLSPKTVTDTLSVIRSTLQFAAREGKYVPCDARNIHIKQNAKEMRILSRGEQERLCQYLYSDLNSFNIGILVCLFTGLRVGEICALRWEDISFTDQTIHVCRTMQRIQNKTSTAPKTRVIVTPPKSSCSTRTIPIPEDLLRILSCYNSVPTGYFLTNNEHRFVEPRTMQNRFRRALQNSSVESVNFHSLRHTFATRCVELNFDVKSLSEILGHASVNITMNRYVHPSIELKRENMQKLSSLFAVK